MKKSLKRRISPTPKTLFSLKIGKGITIGEIVKKYPKTTSVFIDYGLHCIGCPVALSETVEEATKVHKIDLKKFLNDLNKAAK